MGFFRNLINKPVKNRLRQYVEFLSASKDEDIGMILALGTLARKLMIEYSPSLKYLLDQEHPFNYEYVNDYVAQAHMDIYNMAIELEKHAKTNHFMSLLLGGFAVWKMTILCLMGKKDEFIDQEAYIIGRLIWKELDRGIPYVESALNELKSNGVTVDEWSYKNCKYSPEMFAT